MRFLSVEEFDDVVRVDPSEIPSAATAQYDEAEASADIGDSFNAIDDAYAVQSTIDVVSAPLASGELSDLEAPVVQAAVEGLLISIGDRRLFRNVTNEGFKDKVKEIGKKILEFFKRVLAKIKEWLGIKQKGLQAAEAKVEEVKKEEKQLLSTLDATQIKKIDEVVTEQNKSKEAPSAAVSPEKKSEAPHVRGPVSHDENGFGVSNAYLLFNASKNSDNPEKLFKLTSSGKIDYTFLFNYDQDCIPNVRNQSAEAFKEDFLFPIKKFTELVKDGKIEDVAEAFIRDFSGMAEITLVLPDMASFTCKMNMDLLEEVKSKKDLTASKIANLIKSFHVVVGKKAMTEDMSEAKGLKLEVCYKHEVQRLLVGSQAMLSRARKLSDFQLEQKDFERDLNNSVLIMGADKNYSNEQCILFEAAAQMAVRYSVFITTVTRGKIKVYTEAAEMILKYAKECHMLHAKIAEEFKQAA
jgi:hypothetical protein